MKESDWTNKLVHLAQLHGWLIMHQLPAMNQRGQWRTATQGDTGWPDLALVHPQHGFILAELKRDQRSKLTDQQKKWRDHLIAAGIEYHVWRPSDLDAILDRLRGEPWAS